jgi:hypothetical protein
LARNPYGIRATNACHRLSTNPKEHPMPATAEAMIDPEEAAIAAEVEAHLSKQATTPANVSNAQPALVSVDFKRAKGRCVCRVDARAFHAYLDSVGVQYDERRDHYADLPRDPEGYSVFNTSSSRVCPMVLLRRPRAGESAVEWDLMEHYSVPPIATTLEAIGESFEAVIDRIVEHYRPVEVSVRIHQKGGK